MQARRDWITRTPKWLLLAAFWTAQAVVLYFAQALLYASQEQVHGFEIVEQDDGSFAGVRTEDTNLLGEWPTWDEYAGLLTMTEFIVWMGGGIVAITLAQAVFLWPVRRPGPLGPKGRGARASLCIAGAAIAMMVFAVVLAWYGVADEYERWGPDAIDSLPVPRWTVVATIIGVGWAVATPLLFAFARAGPKETTLARLSRRLLLGTIVEIALLIPLDVMVRRKTSCYCWAGTYWALTVCAAVGVFALGPAVFLPLLARRRRTWHAAHCPVCGYDMTGGLGAPKCPECGTGWRA
jgi:hypothetical protein